MATLGMSEADKAAVTAALRGLFPAPDVRVATWEEHQGSLLAAIDVERGILNLLLFMIVGVAGFSILAIFTMIVSEKYRDIGILKSLGASTVGTSERVQFDRVRRRVTQQLALLEADGPAMVVSVSQRRE